MSSSFTTNKSIEEPASGDYDNAWATPVNANWTKIDTALGGTTALSVTGESGVVTLSSTQYIPPNIEISGVLTATVVYQIPTGVGGLWTIKNSATGTGGVVQFSINAGNTLTLGPGRSLIVSDGVSLDYSDSNTIATAEAFASSVASEAETNAVSIAATNANSTYVKLVTTVGLMTGVTIQGDPGTTPSGAPGDLFLYY
jgi:hypothetical protein